MKIARLAVGVGVLTFISRIFGYIRDIAIAFFLGASVFNDAFIIALRLPNMFRSIFGEGALNSAFVPLFYNKLKRDGTQSAIIFARNIQVILLISLILFCCIMMYFMHNIVVFLAPGYAGNTQIMELATSLGIISFPYIIFISLMAFYGGISNTLGNYMPFASAPIILNILLVIFIFFGDSQLEKTYWLTISLPIAGICEMLWVMYFVYKRIGIIKLKLPEVDEDTKALLKRILPGIFGSGISQINIVVSTAIASFVPSGVSYLYYADRIYQLPLAIIGTALGTVMLSELSSKYAKFYLAKFRAIQNQAIVFSLFLTLPAALGIMILSSEIISALFQYGAFTEAAKNETSAALMVFAFGLPMYCFIKIFSSTFFAAGDTKTPVKVAAIVLIINVIVSFALLPYFNHVAVAIGSVAASYANAILLWYILNKSGLYVTYKKSKNQVFKIFIISNLVAGLMILLKYILPVYSDIYALVIYGSTSIIVYLAGCLYFNAYPIKRFFKF